MIQVMVKKSSFDVAPVFEDNFCRMDAVEAGVVWVDTEWKYLKDAVTHSPNATFREVTFVESNSNNSIERIKKMAKFMNDKGEILEGTYVSDAQVDALDFLLEGLANERYKHLGIIYINIQTREEIIKFVAKNFKIERITTDPEASDVVDEVKL